MYLFYFLAAVSIWFGIQSLLSGFRYAAYIRREASLQLSGFRPFVSVIAPSRGAEFGLADNVRALLHQNYPAYEVLFVFDRLQDTAVNVIEGVRDSERDSPRVVTKKVIAGPATDSGQKVHNLRVATDQIDARSEVLVFVDTDARPDTNWLRQLVAPLANETLGASSGYRWFVPDQGGLASRLRSVWNASVASALGANHEKNFCWGGSTAIRCSTFERLKVRDRWQGSVSDDFTLTRVLHEAKLPIHFTPHCLVPSLGSCTLHELLEFTTRQIKITRVYAPQLWKQILLGGILFVTVFFGGIALLIFRIALGLPSGLLVAILTVIFMLGAAKAFIRWRAISIPLAKYRNELRRDLAAHIFLWPLASLLYLYNAIVAALSRRILWRGISYQLKSPTEAVIISRNS
jgi:ceramide glucosyltransferase